MNSISKEFNRFAEHQAKTSSPLYYFWSKKIAQDVEMLKMMAKIPETQPKPNLFFASVQYVLSNKDDVLKNMCHPLSIPRCQLKTVTSH